jgi:type II secretory pathway pseudopilin PulG
MTAWAPGVRRAPPFPAARRRRGRSPGERGATALELLLAVAIVATTAGMAIPATRDAADEVGTSMAARYLSARLARARMDAVTQSRTVALRFSSGLPDYQYATYADGNGNGARTAEMLSGVDPRLTALERIADKFPGVSLGLRPGVPDLDGSLASGTDGVRFGSARIVSFTPDGTATSGTAYLHGRRSQFAVRVLGATGRVRVFRFDTGTGWVAH